MISISFYNVPSHIVQQKATNDSSMLPFLYGFKAMNSEGGKVEQ